MKEEVKGLITIQDGELFVHNNNSVISKDGISTLIEGDYIITGNDVRKLLVMFDKGTIIHNMYIPYVYHNTKIEYGGLDAIVDEKMAKVFNSLIKANDDLSDDNCRLKEQWYSDAHESAAKYNKINKQIDEYNKRGFLYRMFNKLKIK